MAETVSVGTMIFDDPNLFTISTLLRAVKNYWLAGVFVFLLAVSLSICAMVYLPRSYESEAMVFVKLGRETVSLDPTASTGSTISVLDTRDNEINSIRDMLYSRRITENIVDRIGPDVILGDVEYTGETFQPPEFPESDSMNSSRQKAIRQLDEDTYVVSARKSSVLILHAEAPSPELAQRIVKEYLDVYQRMHTEAHQTPESNEFFKQQANILKVQWRESMKALQIAKEEAGVVSIEGARENLKAQTNGSQSTLMNVEGQLAATQAMVEKFDRLIKINPLDLQSVRADYLEAKAKLVALLAEKRALKSQVGQLLERAAKLNRDEVMIQQLDQEVQLAATNYAQYQELYEQTRIEEALHSSRFTNVRVVQEPSFVPKPVSPKKTIIGLAGLMAGGTGSVLTILLLELLFSTRPVSGQTADVLEKDGPENNEFQMANPTSSQTTGSSASPSPNVEVFNSANG